MGLATPGPFRHFEERVFQHRTDLKRLIQALRSAGKRIFLLTNSRPAYTERMMTHLLQGSLAEYPSWRNFFDIIVTAASKPRFFTEHAPFQEVIDGAGQKVATSFERGKMYTGGSIDEFERLVAAAGDRILYVGDHIYGDVLRAKKDSAWRTMMRRAISRAAFCIPPPATRSALRERPAARFPRE